MTHVDWVVKLRPRHALLLSLLSLAGCARVSTISYPSASYMPTNARDIRIYHIHSPVQWEAIGRVSYLGPPWLSWESVYKRFQREAAKLGGDAVVIRSQDSPLVESYLEPRRTFGSSGQSKGPGDQPTPTVAPGYGKYAEGQIIKFVRPPAD